MKENKKKSINLHKETWRRLLNLKADLDKKSFEEVLIMLLNNFEKKK